MIGLKKLLAYGLLAIGTLFLLVVVCSYLGAGGLLVLLSGAAFVGSGRLLWSNRLSHSRSHDRMLAAAAEQTHLRKIFYQIVTDQQGAFTLMQFAIAAGTSPEIAQDFLNHHATTFNAHFTVNDAGSVVYQFPVN
jgi:hypothetical protein